MQMKNGGYLKSETNVITYEEICANLKEAVNIYCEQKSEEKVRAFVKKQRTKEVFGYENRLITLPPLNESDPNSKVLIRMKNDYGKNPCVRNDR